MGWGRRLESLLRDLLQSDLTTGVSAERSVNRAIAVNYGPESCSRAHVVQELATNSPAPADEPSEETRSR